MAKNKVFAALAPSRNSLVEQDGVAELAIRVGHMEVWQMLTILARVAETSRRRGDLGKLAFSHCS
jgi:hypothetical protein